MDGWTNLKKILFGNPAAVQRILSIYDSVIDLIYCFHFVNCGMLCNSVQQRHDLW